MTVIAFYNQKGGVGKTAASVNFAYLAALEGYRTLLWDLDPQGAAGFYFQVNSTQKLEAKKLLTNDLGLSGSVQESGYDNLSIVASDISARNADVNLNDTKAGKKRIQTVLRSVKNDYDIIILDCPPGLSVLHDNIFNASDLIIVPNIPTVLSIRSYQAVVEYFDEQGLENDKLRCFFSMVDHRKNLHHEVLNEHHRDKKFFKNYIPYLSDVEKMGQQFAPVETFAHSSYAAQCYRDLWKEIKKAAHV